MTLRVKNKQLFRYVRQRTYFIHSAGINYGWKEDHIAQRQLERWLNISISWFGIFIN